MTRPHDTQSSLADIDRKLRELQAELARVFDSSAPPEPSGAPDPPAEPAPPAAEPPTDTEPTPAPWSAQPAAPAQPGGYPGAAIRAFESGAGARAPEPQFVPSPAPEPVAAAGAPYDPPAPASLMEEALARVDELGRYVVEIQRLYDELARATEKLAAEYRRFPEPPIRPEAPPIAAPPEPADAHPRFSDVVIINAGPFFDIATLSELQDALRTVPGVEDAAVRSFDGDRALVDVRLTAPTHLVQELHRVLRFPFSVIAVGHELITINLDPAGG